MQRYPKAIRASFEIAARVVDIGGPWPRCDAQVIRVYKSKRIVLYQGVNLTKAAGVYERKLQKLRDGDLVLYVNGEQARVFHGGYNRTRW